MTQLIFNGVYLPEVSRDRYSCHETALGTQLEMVSGRTVTEVRGKVWEAQYAFDRLPDTTWRAICGALRGRKSVLCTMLPDDSDEMVTATMVCTSYTNPTFGFSRLGKPIWHNVSFTLREVAPHA